jgi:site-specific DNA recombinase
MVCAGGRGLPSASKKARARRSEMKSSRSFGKKSHDGTGNIILHVPWQKANSTRRREVILPKGTELRKLRPIRSENRATLIASIARGRRWLDELIGDPTATSESIAKRESCSVRKVNMTISLAFLAPDLVRAALDGQLPHGMGVARLTDLPAEWHRQYDILGLSP